MINIQNNSLSIKDNVAINLALFRKARLTMLLDFIIPEKKPDLYRDMFKYENSSTAMQLIMQKYFLYWIKEHWIIFDSFIVNTDGIADIDRTKLSDFFNKNILLLLQKFDLKYESINLIEDILAYKEKVFNHLLESAENSKNNQYSLEFQLEREIKLIERKLIKFNL